MKNIEKICVAIHLFTGLGALAGGAAAISDPLKPLGLEAAQALQYSPFDNFFIPGLLLFGIIGLGNLYAALSFFRNIKLKFFISGFFASALIIWIIVQCIMLRTVIALQVIFFIIGTIQGLLALFLLHKRYD